MAPRGAEGMNRPTAQRRVHQGDALPWLRAAGTLAGASVVTSLPDASELPALGVDGWRRWFDQAAVLTMQCVPDEGVAIFFQSDVKRAGLWLDKGVMVSRAAERAGMGMLFHKIVCRKPPGTLTYGRASYSHLLGFARVLRPTLRRATPDLLPDGGVQPGVKAMGDRSRGGQRPRAGRDRRRSVRAHVQARPASLRDDRPVSRRGCPGGVPESRLCRLH